MVRFEEVGPQEGRIVLPQNEIISVDCKRMAFWQVARLAKKEKRAPHWSKVRDAIRGSKMAHNSPNN